MLVPVHVHALFSLPAFVFYLSRYLETIEASWYIKMADAFTSPRSTQMTNRQASAGLVIITSWHLEQINLPNSILAQYWHTHISVKYVAFSQIFLVYLTYHLLQTKSSFYLPTKKNKRYTFFFLDNVNIWSNYWYFGGTQPYFFPLHRTLSLIGPNFHCPHLT